MDYNNKMSYFVFEMGNDKIDFNPQVEIGRELEINVLRVSSQIGGSIRNFLKTKPPFQHDTQRSSSIH